MWKSGNFFFKFRDRNSQKSKYKFRTPTDGYLVYKHQIHPKTRKLLSFISDALRWLVKKLDENDRVNREILRDLDLPGETKVKDLDAFYKREFRKKKYIFYFEKRTHQDLPEPTKTYKYFLPKKQQSKVKSSFASFLKTFENSSS